LVIPDDSLRGLPLFPVKYSWVIPDDCLVIPTLQYKVMLINL